MRTLAILALVTGLAAGSAEAQSNVDELPAVFMGSVRPIAPPEGAGAWTLQVITRGGLTGRGAGDFVVVSDGSLRRPDRVTPMRPDALRPLSRRIRMISPSLWPAESRLGRCNDCYATLIVLTLRERDGTPRTYAAFWDATTRVRVPVEVLQLYDLALGLSSDHPLFAPQRFSRVDTDSADHRR